MTDIEVWATIGTLIIMVIGLIISIIKLWFIIKKNDKSLQTLAEIVNINRKQVEILNKEITEKIKVERERLQLDREKEQAKEKWKQLEAAGKIAKYILESDLDL